jgi:hypothetical protein
MRMTAALTSLYASAIILVAAFLFAAKGEDDKASSCGGNGRWMRVVRAGQAYRGRLIISFAFA